MGCVNLVVSIIFFIYLFSLSKLLIIVQYTTAQSIYINHLCLGANYTTGSLFQTNLNLFINSLSANNLTIIKDGYYNNTVGRKPDTVYGSFQCRGDLKLDDCKNCVKTGIQDIKANERCPNSKQAIIWYNDYKFHRILGDLVNSLATNATSNSGFARGHANLTNSIEVYGFVQCSADLFPSDCYRCVLGVIAQLPNCCYGKKAGRVSTPSCVFRYDLDPYFQTTITSAPLLSTNTTAPISNGSNSSNLAISITVPSVVIAVLSSVGFWFLCFRRKKTDTEKFVDVNDAVLKTQSLQFNFCTICASTNSFSEANKLGEGGFGSVYKGTLPSGQEIAVKRLSKISGQGEREFKNEVTLVAKLQHKNLVKLVGFSLAGEEKLLIYEFMPNASLDQFLFDPIKCRHLIWERRYKILGGIAKGLVYLHEESRLKIIHRDLKASNILLDIDMNPKIADFGMAKLFVLDQTQASTNRIVGTHGYMPPEYIMHGKFSVKSDVFSFGVLVLEILTGKRNSCFQGPDIARNLLSYAWSLYIYGSAMELLDPTLKGAYSTSEAMKCIHVALLCVQENVADRPTMPTVVQMLSNSLITQESPSPPAFFAGSTINIEPLPTLNLSDSEEQGNSAYHPIREAVTM
ncbi:putative receptor-like protein kinase At4g00960 [Papaver somniferum]|uniref:putative receptor-like protein kinase At4g00960 n=1 Tax=Papaver somniferum TaxID=3469 RepID=UPI000E6F47FD|nr:putative receptor-like protein kinase At4g00960 [Papaver somniferum]